VATKSNDTINGFPISIFMAINAAMDNLIISGSDPDQDGEPYHSILLREDRTSTMIHTVDLDKNHQEGRLLDALILGEATIDKKIPEELEKSLKRLLFESFDYKDHLNRFVHQENGPMMHAHNLREGLLGLNALTSYRNDELAREKANNMLKTMSSISNEQGRLSIELAASLGINTGYINYESFEYPPPQTTGRFVGALVKYYRTTGNENALELADLYASDNLLRGFPLGGQLQDDSGTHVHSITSALMGLLDWAITRRNHEAILQLKSQFDQGFVEISSSYGWFKEERVINGYKARGENTGDMVQAALHLARAGYSEYYEKAEIYMRSFILPGQMRSVGLFVENPGATIDSLRHIRRRLHGGYGFPSPNDRFASTDKEVSVNATDVTAGVVTAMCEFLKHICIAKDKGVSINLHFSVENQDVSIVSFLPHKGRLDLIIKSEKAFSVRIPTGISEEQILLIIDNERTSVMLNDNYIQLGILLPGNKVEIHFPLIEKFTREKVWEHDLSIFWRGAQVLSIYPSGSGSPMFQEDIPPTQAWGVVTCELKGTPLSNAMVVIRGLEGTKYGSAFTDLDGNYAIDTDIIASGEYILEVFKEGYQRMDSDRVTLIKGWPETIHFRMKPERS